MTTRIRIGAAYDEVSIETKSGTATFDRAAMHKDGMHKELHELRRTVVRGFDNEYEGKPNADKHARRREFNAKKRAKREQG